MVSFSPTPAPSACRLHGKPYLATTHATTVAGQAAVERWAAGTHFIVQSLLLGNDNFTAVLKASADEVA